MENDLSSAASPTNAYGCARSCSFSRFCKATDINLFPKSRTLIGHFTYAVFYSRLNFILKIRHLIKFLSRGYIDSKLNISELINTFLDVVYIFIVKHSIFIKLKNFRKS